MKALVIGSGGREHALCWKLAQSDRVNRLYCAPGNGGIKAVAETADIGIDDIKGLAAFAGEKGIDLTVVGPEMPLVAGVVDEFTKRGLRIFGPTREAARLEGSKIFAKELMKRHRVPTAGFKIFDNAEKATAWVKKRGLPLVVKADGLAAGKGVMVCRTRGEAEKAVEAVMVDKRFGSSGGRIIIEDCMEGEEASIIVLSDGTDVLQLASSQDHKRILDDDRGANTGGMGACSPAPVITAELEERIMRDIIRPVIDGMREDGTPFKGVLYAGIMVTAGGPKVLEFNVRFGDPETQAILPRLKNDLVTLMEASIAGRLKDEAAVWDPRPCVCVVMASAGYPGVYEKGKAISGLKEAAGHEDITVFHAGTRLRLSQDDTERSGSGARLPHAEKNGQGQAEEMELVTSGGRVFGVTALGGTIREAIGRAYKAVAEIRFEGVQYRADIGKRALERVLNLSR